MPEPSGLSTDMVKEGTVNQYFTVARAQTAVATMFTGSANSNVVFTYDANRRLLSANVTLPTPNPTGIMSIEQDTSPRLGGDLDLNGHKIAGLPASISKLEQDTSPRLGGNLDLNSYGIVGLPASISKLEQDTGPCLGGNLDLNNYSIVGKEIPLKIYGVADTETDGIPWFSINGTRGTIENPKSTEPGDCVAGLKFQGHTGNNFYAFSGGIISNWETQADLTDVNPECPASTISFVVGTGNKQDKLKFCTFNSHGVLSAPVLQTGSRTDYPLEPKPGMIIFNNNDGHFYGFNGNVWKQLDRD
jgi:hypothetical protein